MRIVEKGKALAFKTLFVPILTYSNESCLVKASAVRKCKIYPSILPRYNAIMHFQWTIACSHSHHLENVCGFAVPQILRNHFQCYITENQISTERKNELKFEVSLVITNFMMPNVRGAFLFWKNSAKCPNVISSKLSSTTAFQTKFSAKWSSRAKL